ncbi:hypothetical protein [Candidatus Darwinibacter acetoxidans]
MTHPILYISGPYSAGSGRTVADNIAVLRERCYRVREYFAKKEATL